MDSQNNNQFVSKYSNSQYFFFICKTLHRSHINITLAWTNKNIKNATFLLKLYAVNNESLVVTNTLAVNQLTKPMLMCFSKLILRSIYFPFDIFCLFSAKYTTLLRSLLMLLLSKI